MSNTTRAALRGGPVAPASGRLTPLGPDELRITGGFWGDLQRLNAVVVLDHCESWMERIGWIPNFDLAAAGTVAAHRRGIEFVDSEVYKLLEAMAWELGRQPDADLETRYGQLVDRVVAAQEPDGYLHTAFGRAGQPPRYSNLEWGHELYCFGHLFQAAVARLRSGVDDALPAAARRLADHVWTEFGPEGRVAICGHPEIEMGLAELGRATGEGRYLELARLFLERRGHGTLATTLFQGSDYFLDDMPVRDAEVLRGHAVRATYLTAGATDVAVDTGDEVLLAAVQRQWAATIARRTYLTGGMGAHHQNEAFGDDFELPADRAYAETCAAIGSVMLSWRLLLATGEAKYADAIERTLLNAVLVGPREDGRAFFYANTLHQREPGVQPADDELSQRAEASLRAPWFEVSCCPTNIARTLASVAGYVATRDANGVHLHQYANVAIDTKLDNGERVDLTVATEYPLGAHIRIEVWTAGAYDLTLRLPEWAADATVDARSHAVRRRSDALIVVGPFEAGDTVELTLPLAVRTTRPDPRMDAVRGTVAFERGPLVLALESPDLPDGTDINSLEVIGVEGGDDPTPRIVLRRTAPPNRVWPFGTEAQATEPTDQVLRAPLIPYAAWGNRGPATMRVWVPEGMTP